MKKVLIIFIFFITSPAIAQQTIFNVPSADVTPKNKNFLQHESQFRAKDPDQFLNTTNYYARGIGHSTELDATLFNVGSPASKNAALGIGFKSPILLPLENLKDYQPKVILGSMAPISLQGNGIGHWGYASGSFVIPQTKSRFTAGISNGTKQIFGESVTCFIGGFEQELTSNLTFVNDWYSGKHALGLFASGFSYKLPQNLTLYGGAQIPNSRAAGRKGFLVEIAKIF